MAYSHSVQRRTADVTMAIPAMRARVRIIRSDPFGAFAQASARQTPRRLTIVSPWINDDCDRQVTLAALIRHAEVHRAAVVVITRPPASGPHKRALELVRTASRSRIYLNPRLHAKLYVCESAQGGGLAVIGSANGTGSSASLHEIALLIRPDRGSAIISELAGATVRGLMDKRLPTR